LGRAEAALLVATALWVAAFVPMSGPTSTCDAGPADAAACRRAAAREPAQLLFGGRLDLNRASARSLQALPGIGPARADAIVAERCRAPFVRVGDVERVPGIGPTLRARMLPRVSVEAGGAALCAGAAPN